MPFVPLPKHDYYSERQAPEEYKTPTMGEEDDYLDRFALSPVDEEDNYPDRFALSPVEEADDYPDIFALSPVEEEDYPDRFALSPVEKEHRHKNTVTTDDETIAVAATAIDGLLTKAREGLECRPVKAGRAEQRIEETACKFECDSFGNKLPPEPLKRRNLKSAMTTPMEGKIVEDDVRRSSCNHVRAAGG
jgi:hypothetical protein